VRERALFGMGRVLEATSTGDLQPAITAYQKLLQEFPGSPYTEIVTEQIEQLERKPSQEFYAWFAEQKPQLEDRQLPADFMRSLNLDGMLPPAGEAPAPEGSPVMPTDAAPGEAPATSAEPGPSLSVPSAPEFPPAGATPPATDTPATPATETPTTPAPPAAETPAPESPAPTTETPAPPAAEPTPPATEPTPPATETPAPASESPAAETPSSETPAAETDTSNGN
jgi:hypothetical protein